MRILWNLFGFGFVGLGLFGLVTPGFPGTVFLIIALGCFGRAQNETLRRWMLGHPKFGQILRDWEEDRSIPLWVKWVSCCCIVGFTGLSVVMIPVMWVKGVMVGLAVAGVAYILSKKTKLRSSVEAGEGYGSPSAENHVPFWVRPGSPDVVDGVDETPGDKLSFADGDADAGGDPVGSGMRGGDQVKSFVGIQKVN